MKKCINFVYENIFLVRKSRMEIRQNRVNELDYLKCVFIVLMIIFHLAYFSDRHLVLKQFVYTFHMPAFLLISGYLVNVGKPWRSFLSYVRWLIVPYVVMEAGYVVMASLLPIREHIDNLTPGLFFENLVLHPIGPYWFIHTLILLEVMLYSVSCMFKHSAERIVVMALLCWLLSLPQSGLLSFANAVYFIMGAVMRLSGLGFQSFFASKTPITVLPLMLLCLDDDNFDRSIPAGMAVTWLVISLLLYIYKYTGAVKTMLYIGRHTLIILLFSPIFTLLAKVFIPLFAFDDSAFLFMLFSVVFVLCGCFALAKLLDIMSFSRFLLGKEKSV